MAIKIKNNVNQQEINRRKNQKDLFLDVEATLAGIQADIDALPTATEAERVQIISRCLTRQSQIINTLNG